MCDKIVKNCKKWEVDRQGFICLTQILYHLKANNVSFNLVQSAIETNNLTILPDLDYNRTLSQKLSQSCKHFVKNEKLIGEVLFV